jgi:cbb3-type cytochrome oxidase subunit 3
MIAYTIGLIVITILILAVIAWAVKHPRAAAKVEAVEAEVEKKVGG